MSDSTELKIVGIDESRPPRVRKEPYIDLVFKLSAKAPKEWCEDFNMLFKSSVYPVRIEMPEGLYIVTWVKTMDEIPAVVEKLKEKVAECNAITVKRKDDYEQSLKQASEALKGEQGEQGRLNEIIANLKFD